MEDTTPKDVDNWKSSCSQSEKVNGLVYITTRTMSKEEMITSIGDKYGAILKTRVRK